MTKTQFTTITPLPAGISRETVLSTLHTHTEMIDLNPSHEERHRISPPPEATPEEYHCQWYQITDKVSYLPAGMYTGSVSFKACFHDLAYGLQTHVYAPMGLDIKEKWTLGGSLPGEPMQPVEIGIGVPISGLYLREDVEMKCNFLMTKFVKKTLKQSLATLVARLVVKSQLQEAAAANRRLTYDPTSQYAPPLSPPLSPPMSPPAHAMGFPTQQQQWQGMPSPGHSPALFKQQMAQYPPQQYPGQPFVNELDSSQSQKPVGVGYQGQIPGPQSHPGIPQPQSHPGQIPQQPQQQQSYHPVELE
jgi:hypothetical protein